MLQIEPLLSLAMTTKAVLVLERAVLVLSLIQPGGGRDQHAGFCCFSLGGGTRHTVRYSWHLLWMERMEVVRFELFHVKRFAFLRCQISSKIRAMVRDTFQCPQVWQRASGGLMKRLTMSSVEEVETTSDLKPQQIVNHRAFAIGQNKKRWFALSEVFLQRLQDD